MRAYRVLLILYVVAAGALLGIACTAATDDTQAPSPTDASNGDGNADAVARDALSNDAGVAACDNVAERFLGRFVTAGRNEPCTSDPECTLFEPRLECSSGMTISGCPYATSKGALPTLEGTINEARDELCPLNCRYSGGPTCEIGVARCLDGGCTSVVDP